MLTLTGHDIDVRLYVQSEGGEGCPHRTRSGAQAPSRLEWLSRIPPSALEHA